MVRGSCLCGQVKFAVNGPIKALGNCHCSECRKAYGSAFGTIAVCEYKYFKYITGEHLISSYKQSEDVTRTFCKNCGSRLPILDESDPLVGIPAGLLDDDPIVRPSQHIYVGSKAPWWEITDNIPQFNEWSPESKAAREKTSR